jgi:multisubunit Na+/H+ antiporter MnhB subunit
MTTTILTRTVSRALLTPVLAVAAAILVKGYADVGDGFAAAAVAALGVLLQYVGCSREEAERLLIVRRATQIAFGGLSLALAVALVPWLAGGAILEHSPRPGSEPVYLGTLELITAFAFDIGIFGLVLGAAVAIIDAIARERATLDEPGSAL